MDTIVTHFRETSQSPPIRPLGLRTILDRHYSVVGREKGGGKGRSHHSLFRSIGLPNFYRSEFHRFYRFKVNFLVSSKVLFPSRV